jgi:hypothetical protein
VAQRFITIVSRAKGGFFEKYRFIPCTSASANFV